MHSKPVPSPFSRLSRPSFPISRLAAAAALTALLVCCRSTGDAGPPTTGTAPTTVPTHGAPARHGNAVVGDMGRHHWAITTSSPVAQELFDQGIAWCYGFHHAEAIRSFTEALAADPSCAMAHWGIAYAAGPHINNTEMDPAAARQAYDHAQKALALAAATTPLERAMIEALARRYTWPQPEDQKPLNQAYADAMRAVYRDHGEHPDVAVLYAEAMMNLRPWDLWTKDGEPQPGTPEIVQALERLLAAHPDHPHGNHLHIHAVEASPEPERAVPAAERLGTLVPASGHLVHMPSHIWIRLGRYADAAEANRRSIEADLRIVRRTGRKGFYEMYRAHAYHFLVYSAMFEGRAEEAIATARAMLRELPKEVVKAMPQFLDGFMAVPLHAMVRFGRWNEILEEPAPEDWLPATRTLWHYARGIALASLGRVDEAVAERGAFAAALAKVPESFTFGNNPARVVLAVGKALLDGEVEFRRGNTDAAFASLREAVRLEDELRYDEPWGWMMPARHPLGALLLEAGHVDEAEEVYRADLARHPENGWALHGLRECLERRGATAEAAAAKQRFEQSWAHADVQIAGSCFCRRS